VRSAEAEDADASARTGSIAIPSNVAERLDNLSEGGADDEGSSPHRRAESFMDMGLEPTEVIEQPEEVDDDKFAFIDELVKKKAPEESGDESNKNVDDDVEKTLERIEDPELRNEITLLRLGQR